jgi:hypothetical protein
MTEFAIVAAGSVTFGFVVLALVRAFVRWQQRTKRLRDEVGRDQYSAALSIIPATEVIDFGESMPAHQSRHFQSSKV